MNLTNSTHVECVRKLKKKKFIRSWKPFVSLQPEMDSTEREWKRLCWQHITRYETCTKEEKDLWLTREGPNCCWHLRQITNEMMLAVTTWKREERCRVKIILIEQSRLILSFDYFPLSLENAMNQLFSALAATNKINGERCVSFFSRTHDESDGAQILSSSPSIKISFVESFSVAFHLSSTREDSLFCVGDSDVRRRKRMWCVPSEGIFEGCMMHGNEQHTNRWKISRMKLSFIFPLPIKKF